jgi:hypothetical protein
MDRPVGRADRLGIGAKALTVCSVRFGVEMATPIKLQMRPRHASLMPECVRSPIASATTKVSAAAAKQHH